MKPIRPVGFMNVDLEIVSRTKLEAIETSLSDLVHVLYSGPGNKKGTFLLALESNKYPKNADTGILALCAAVESLSKTERRLWDRALSRRFDVGYELILGENSVAVALESETLRRLADLRAEVAFTCYREGN
jgi:hypothetical protein